MQITPIVGVDFGFGGIDPFIGVAISSVSAAPKPAGPDLFSMLCCGIALSVIRNREEKAATAKGKREAHAFVREVAEKTLAALPEEAEAIDGLFKRLSYEKQEASNLHSLITAATDVEDSAKALERLRQCHLTSQAVAKKLDDLTDVMLPKVGTRFGEGFRRGQAEIRDSHTFLELRKPVQ